MVGQSQKQKVKLGFQKYNVIAKSTLADLLFTKKFRIEIYRMSTFQNFWKTYVTP